MRIFRQKSNNSVKFQVRKSDINVYLAADTLIEFAKDAHNSDWYFEANKWAQEVAQRLGYTLEQVVGVTALLSPMTEWELNKRRAERVLVAWQGGEKISVHMKRTMENVYKCLNGEPFTFGPKTGVFYQNILTPNENIPATVDSLAISIVLGMGAIPGTYSVKANTLESIQEVYAIAAQHYGVPISSLQAATWVKANGLRKANHGLGAIMQSRFSEIGLNDLAVSEVLELIA